MITAISDTASWVAWYRALESARPDKLFDDPWAAALAGERGQAIADSMRGLRDTTGVIAVRTALIDHLVTETIARDRIDTVINLACGFDTRPFRLDLPAQLRWFDIDGPAIVERKRALLAAAPARCSWQLLTADLADDTARRQALGKALRGAQRALVLTEGLLLYLQRDQVAALANDLAAQPACACWVTDLLSVEGQRRSAAIYKKPFAASGIAVRFGVEDSSAFFAELGFAEVESRSTIHEAYKLQRLSRLYTWMIALTQLFAGTRHTIARSSRVVRFERISHRHVSA